MNLVDTDVSDSYIFLLNQSGGNITLGDGSAVDWANTDLIDKTNNQTISGEKIFTKAISVSFDIGASATPQAYLSNGDYYTKINSKSSSSTNPLIANGDHSIIFGDLSIDSPLANLVIGPYSSQARGLKINDLGHVGVGTEPTCELDVGGAVNAVSFSGQSFSGQSFSGQSFSGNSFIGDSFSLRHYNFKLAQNTDATPLNTWKTLHSQELSSGSWLASASTTISGTATTRALIRLYGSNGTCYATALMSKDSSVSTYMPSMSLSTIIELTSNTTIYFDALSLAATNFLAASGVNASGITQACFVRIS